MESSALRLMMCLVGIALIFPLGFTLADAQNGPSTRSAGEDLYFDVLFEIEDPLDYEVLASFEVSIIEISGGLYSADQLRDMYVADPSGTMDSIEGEMLGRVRDRVVEAVQGATVEVKAFAFGEGTLDDTVDNQGQPVAGTIDLTVEVDPAQYIPQEYLDGIQDPRLPYVISGLIQMGFRFSETYRFTAGIGESLLYRIPSHIRPMGDPSIDLLVEIPGEVTPIQYHEITITGVTEPASETHVLRLRSASPIAVHEESVEGLITADLKDLGTATVSASAQIMSVDLAGTGIADELPQGVEAPSFLSSGAIRYLVLEGALDEADLEIVQGRIADDASEQIEGSLDADLQLTVDLDLKMGSLDPPTSGTALNSILSSSIPLDLGITSNGEVELNITQGYDPSDVLSLLHGGLVLQHEFDRVQDDRFETHIVLPEGLFLEGKDPVAPPVSGRSTYPLPWGLTGIGSDKAPIMSGENVRLTGVVRMEDLRSIYLIDSVIAASADLDLELGWIEYDPSLVGADIDIDYRVDHLSADMIRLLLKMGIAEESDIKERISRSIERFLDDSIGTDEITIDFEQGTLSADDLGEIDGSDPLLIDVHVESTIDAADPNSGSDQEFAASRAYIPFHMDPILPVKRYEKTVPLADCERWNLSINITFPTGAGVKGWLGREGAEHGTALPVIVVDGVPTMVIESSPGEAEALYLEISGGPYLAFDNVVVCFFGTWTFLAVIVLLVLVSVIKRIVKRARNRKAVKPKVKDSDLDPNDVWSGSGKLKDRPPVRPRR